MINRRSKTLTREDGVVFVVDVDVGVDQRLGVVLLNGVEEPEAQDFLEHFIENFGGIEQNLPQPLRKFSL